MDILDPNFFTNLPPLYKALFIAAMVWSVFWKGLALWKSGRLGEKTWFIVLLLINTLGILEIYYLTSRKNTDPSAKRA